MFACVLSHVPLFATPWTVAHQALLVTEFYRQEYWFCCCSVTQTDSSWPRGLQHGRLPYPSLSPGACSNSCPPSWWCHPTIPSCYPLLPLPSIFPSIRVFLMSRIFPSGGQNIGASASASVLPMNIQDWFPLGPTSLISLKSKGLSRVSSNTTVQKHSFFSVQSSLWSTLISIHTGNIIALTIWTFVSKVMFLY